MSLMTSMSTINSKNETFLASITVHHMTNRVFLFSALHVEKKKP